MRNINAGIELEIIGCYPRDRCPAVGSGLFSGCWRVRGVKEPPCFYEISDPFISHEIFYRTLSTFNKHFYQNIVGQERIELPKS